MRRLSCMFLLLVAASCSGKKSGPLTPTLADRESFCHEWAVHSCSQSVIDKCLAESADSCIAAAKADCEAKVPDGKYSALTAEDCLAAVDAAYQDLVISAGDRDLLLHLGGACSKVLSGSGGTDEACSDDSDCNRDVDLACVKKAGESTGQCEKPNPVSAGASCKAADSVCGDGYYCDPLNHCVEGGAQDEACAPDSPCTSGFRCVGDSAPMADAGAPSADAGPTTSAGATCRPLKKKAELCAAEDECASHICLVVDMAKSLSRCADEIPIVPGSPICAAVQ